MAIPLDTLQGGDSFKSELLNAVAGQNTWRKHHNAQRTQHLSYREKEQLGGCRATLAPAKREPARSPAHTHTARKRVISREWARTTGTAATAAAVVGDSSAVRYLHKERATVIINRAH